MTPSAAVPRDIFIFNCYYDNEFYPLDFSPISIVRCRAHKHELHQTYAPLTAVQGGFFCGTSWSDVTSKCKKRCPSGEDTDCPGEESCFAYTGCTEERGYGSDPSQWIPGYDEFGNSLSQIAAQLIQDKEQAKQEAAEAAALEETGEPLCKNVKVMITADVS